MMVKILMKTLKRKLKIAHLLPALLTQFCFQRLQVKWATWSLWPCWYWWLRPWSAFLWSTTWRWTNYELTRQSWTARKQKNALSSELRRRRVFRWSYWKIDASGKTQTRQVRRNVGLNELRWICGSQWLLWSPRQNLPMDLEAWSCQVHQKTVQQLHSPSQRNGQERVWNPHLPEPYRRHVSKQQVVLPDRFQRPLKQSSNPCHLACWGTCPYHPYVQHGCLRLGFRNVPWLYWHP